MNTVPPATIGLDVTVSRNATLQRSCSVLTVERVIPVGEGWNPVRRSSCAYVTQSSLATDADGARAAQIIAKTIAVLTPATGGARFGRERTR
jgi:hypothetical protein